MIYEEYYTRVMSLVPEAIVSDEFFARNRTLIEAIIFDYYRLDEQQYEEFDPETAAENINLFFTNIKNFGLR